MHLLKEFNYESKKTKSKWWQAKGFTFVETMAVLAIGAVFAAGTTVSATKLIEYARKTAAKSQIEQYSAALQTYFLDCGCYPTTEQGLDALWEEPVLYPVPENWNGPYLRSKPSKDPWGTNFEYISAECSAMPAEVHKKLPFVLICYGSDRKKGGEGDGRDIVSWE